MNASPSQRIFIGIDAGTGGLRAMAVDESGQVLAQAAAGLDPQTVHSESGIHQQQPAGWWDALCRATRQVSAALDRQGIRRDCWTAVCVDGTSGTICPVDARGESLHPALMYNDARGAEQAEQLNDRAGEWCAKLGYRFASSYALAKILWLAQHRPAECATASWFVHQADYLVGRLTNRWGVSDYSNALKTGYDLLDERWPDWIDHWPDLRRRLPEVVAPGTPVARVSAAAADATGLPAGLVVVAGATDGTAAFVASGASRIGDYNTTLGTTLVFKGLSREPRRHPEGLLYCHRLPGGYWLPGAASNTGAEWIDHLFAGSDLAQLDAAARQRLPSRFAAYPLVRTGERFPFCRVDAQGVLDVPSDDPAERFAAYLQGTALLERLAYEVLDSVLGTSGGEVYATGGGSRSEVWMQCRADVTGRVFHQPVCGESAFGAAVFAASIAYDCGGWADAAQRMVHFRKTFLPHEGARHVCELADRAFRGKLRDRGYL